MPYLKPNQILHKGDLYLNNLGEWQETLAIGSSVQASEYGRYFRPASKELPIEVRHLNWELMDDRVEWEEGSHQILAAIQHWGPNRSDPKWDFTAMHVVVDSGKASLDPSTNYSGWSFLDVDYFVILTST